MSDALVMDAFRRVAAAVAECNRVGRDVMSEAAAFTRSDAERVLAADGDRLMGLVMDLLDARGRLAAALAEYDAVKRRR